jgi:hypothetical protein
MKLKTRQKDKRYTHPDKHEVYVALDERAFIKSAAEPEKNLNDIDENWERYVLMVSDDVRDIIEEANDEEDGTPPYGKRLVATFGGEPLWHWYHSGVWEVRD